MQDTKEVASDKTSLKAIGLFNGFFKSFTNISSFLFTIIPPVFTWFFSRNFILVSAIAMVCLFVAVCYTIYTNTKQNIEIIEHLKGNLIISEDKNSELKNDLTLEISKNNKMFDKIKELESNRITIIDTYEMHKKDSIIYQKSYFALRSGICGIKDMQNSAKVNNAIEGLLNHIENMIKTERGE